MVKNLLNTATYTVFFIQKTAFHEQEGYLEDTIKNCKNIII